MSSNLKIILIVGIAIFAVLGMAAFSFLISRNVYYEVREVPYDFLVEGGNVIGMNAGTDALHFGKIPKGSKSVRKLVIENTQDKKIRGSVLFNDTNKDLFKAFPNNFTIDKNNNITIEFHVTIEKDSPNMNTSGYIYVYLFDK